MILFQPADVYYTTTGGIQGPQSYSKLLTAAQKTSLYLFLLFKQIFLNNSFHIFLCASISRSPVCHS